MAKEGTVSQRDLDDLRDAYLEMRARKSQIVREVRERYRKQIQETVDFETRAIERAFGAQLVDLRDRGATRRELVSVIGDGTAETMRRFIELGGGEISKRQTGEDRRVERGLELNLLELGQNRFQYTSQSGSKVEVYLLWTDGKPALWADGEDVKILLEDFPTSADLRKRGEEIASAFEITED